MRKEVIVISPYAEESQRLARAILRLFTEAGWTPKKDGIGGNSYLGNTDLRLEAAGEPVESTRSFKIDRNWRNLRAAMGAVKKPMPEVKAEYGALLPDPLADAAFYMRYVDSLRVVIGAKALQGHEDKHCLMSFLANALTIWNSDMTDVVVNEDEYRQGWIIKHIEIVGRDGNQVTLLNIPYRYIAEKESWITAYLADQVSQGWKVDMYPDERIYGQELQGDLCRRKYNERTAETLHMAVDYAVKMIPLETARAVTRISIARRYEGEKSLRVAQDFEGKRLEVFKMIMGERKKRYGFAMPGKSSRPSHDRSDSTPVAGLEVCTPDSTMAGD